MMVWICDASILVCELYFCDITSTLISSIRSSSAEHYTHIRFPLQSTSSIDSSVLPSTTGFKSLLHELAWVSTYVCVDGCFSDLPADASFNTNIRNQLIEFVKRNIDVTPGLAGSPSASQIALVDVLWLICQYEQAKGSRDKLKSKSSYLIFLFPNSSFIDDWFNLFDSTF